MSDLPTKAVIDPRLLLSSGENIEPRRRLGDPFPGEPEPQGYGRGAGSQLFSNLSLAWRRDPDTRAVQIQRLCAELAKYKIDPCDVLSQACIEAREEASEIEAHEEAPIPPRPVGRPPNPVEDHVSTAIVFSTFLAIRGVRKSIREKKGPSIDRAPEWLAGRQLDALGPVTDFEEWERCELEKSFVSFWKGRAELLRQAVAIRPERRTKLLKPWAVLEEHRLTDGKTQKQAKDSWDYLVRFEKLRKNSR